MLAAKLAQDVCLTMQFMINRKRMRPDREIDQLSIYRQVMNLKRLNAKDIMKTKGKLLTSTLGGKGTKSKIFQLINALAQEQMDQHPSN